MTEKGGLRKVGSFPGFLELKTFLRGGRAKLVGSRPLPSYQTDLACTLSEQNLVGVHKSLTNLVGLSLERTVIDLSILGHHRAKG